jgi:surface carbohydrate biosynthesis protein
VTLFLPIWSQVRELDAKLLVACAVAERGMPVILGSRAPLSYYAHRLPRGIYLAKGGQREGTFFRILRRLGHEIALLDEASLLRLPDDEVREARYAPEAAERVGLFLAWGEDDARMLRATPACAHAAVVVTGNPRIDLTRPELRAYFEPEARALRDRLGEFALLNTNFFGLNHYDPSLSTELQIARGERPSSAYLRAFATHRLAIFERTRALVAELARRLGKHALVVRPHPMENPQVWRDAARAESNVHVVQEGSILPWLLAARVSIANNCTTLVEAHLLGKAGVHFEPLRDDALDFSLPGALSHRAATASDVAELAAVALKGELPLTGADAARRLGAHLAALTGAFAADRIADAVTSHVAELPQRRRRAQRAVGFVESAVRARLKARAGHSRHAEDLHAHRFPELAPPQLEARIARFSALTSRFRGLRVEPVAPHLFLVSS